jgi:hypothetical protein
MCKVDEYIYINKDGSRRTEEETAYCEKADRHRRKLCSKVKRRTTEYYTRASSTISRDDASSPASNGPFTPPTAGTGGYRTEERRPSVLHRPSTRDGPRAINPEIIIEFGKGKSKKYPSFSLSTKPNKRSSLGATSINSNEATLDSPGSDASFTIRTGFPDAPLPPSGTFGQPHGYTTRSAVPQGHRHTPSSSYTTSQVPSLTSEPESPGRRVARYPPALVHNSIPAAPPSPVMSRAAPVTITTSSRTNYRTTTVVPQRPSRDAAGGVPLDYDDFVRPNDRSQTSSGRAAAPEITDRAADRERQRRDQKRRQEEEDRRVAEDRIQEDVKQVRFAEQHAKEETRRQREPQPEKRATKKPEREKTKPPTRDFNKPRRNSITMTQAAKDERDRLIQQDHAQQAREREAADLRDRDEKFAEQQDAASRQRRDTDDYYSTRGTNRVPVTNNGPGIGGRRASMSRRGSVSTTVPPIDIGRSTSTRRVSIIQPTPPAAPPVLTNPYSTRPPSSHLQNPPPMFSPGSYPASRPPPSARHSSYQETPFALPSARTSNTSHTSQDSNPFAAPSTRPIHPMHDGHHPFSPASSVLPSPSVAAPRDPWDARDLRAALPQSTGYPRNAMHMAGEQVINRSGDRAHGRAQRASHSMGMAMGYEDDYESSSEEDERRTVAREYGGTLGQGKGKRRA